jgi:hypothetical protein
MSIKKALSVADAEEVAAGNKLNIEMFKNTSLEGSKHIGPAIQLAYREMNRDGLIELTPMILRRV